MNLLTLSWSKILSASPPHLRDNPQLEFSFSFKSLSNENATRSYSKKGAAQAAALSLNHIFFRDYTLIFFASHFTTYPTRRIRKVNTLLHTTIPALQKRKRKGGVQRRDSAFCPSSGNLPSRKEFI